MNVNDTNNTKKKLNRQWELLDQADISDRDKEAITDFVRIERQGNQNREPNTLYSDLSSLRNAAVRADTSLVEMDLTGFRTLISTLTSPKSQGGYGLDPNGGGIYNYKRALRIFFQWLDRQPDFPDFEFYDSIDITSQSVSRVNEDKMLDDDDIEKLKQHAKNPRDPAIIEFLADTGARVSMASQLRIKDIHDLDTQRPYFTPNPNGNGHKGAPDKRYPILQSRAEIRNWVNQYHPDPRPEAPLWPILRGYDRDSPQECALSNDRLRDALRACGRRAGIEKPVNPHNFRHSAITRLSRQGYTPQQIQHIAGWASDRMLEAYDHTTDRQRNEGMRVKAGFIDESETEDGPTQPKTCGNCRETLKATAQFCPRCGAPTTKETEEAISEQDDRIVESAAMADGELASAVLELRRLVEDSPELRRRLLDV
ncbi:tyrosine-type recombinase/integrase [Haloarcula sediminis]|uniref:tyrosine-type recombinase/integrase n=1 Tax=Haloarcula sediminis TaxID=3111777 RepID=UPI002D766465|nr:tyrosine-type recombinase/integrase [Haloarcula sp. CK38]